MSDPRKVVGNYIKTRAILVTNEAECARRYGARKKTYLVKGVVLESLRVVNQTTGRAGPGKIKALFELGGGDTKEATVSLTSTQISSAIEVLNELPENGVVPLPVLPPPIPRGQEIPLLWNLVTQNPVPLPILEQAPVQAAPRVEETAVDPRADMTVPVVLPVVPPTVVVDPRVQESVLPTVPPVDPRPVAVASPNGMNWYIPENDLLLRDVNGSVPFRNWGVRNSVGDLLHSRCNLNKRFSRLDIFYLMFPPRMLDIIVVETNRKLAEKRGVRLTTKGEILKLFGVFILTTKYEFAKRSSLWSPTPASKYEVAGNFGKNTNFSKHRFDTLFECIRFGHQPNERRPEMSSERYRWLLCDTFVTEFN